ncbi:MAG: creatininase family protein [Desulfobacteraceae bacterium]|jgi:creatinine amidohydrolase/Fe(II)-dependent formamide hydrolase-like protein
MAPKTIKPDNQPAQERAIPHNKPLKDLVVFDRLEVGPVKLEPERLVVPYRTFKGDQRSTFEFIYRFEEPVFDPAEADSQNLAAMMSVQPALNYGLFCKEIVFNGLLDNQDRRFLRTMAENTAREIYVKKFLEPNPFLKGQAGAMPVIKKAGYLAARLTFNVPGKRSFTKQGWQLWPTRRNRYCILSSGGKDSLLSYALINEIIHGGGKKAPTTAGEVHPIFVNESGRHWFTALNAYRHFKDNVPHTARVWVNSDRLFAWMLRQLPFVRKDFADVRSDEYPIRLWTVAVFLFGVLPLARKKGLARLLVGDEFDTSVKANHQGIRHYDGLYDQSIYFDRAISSYFLQKGWAVNVFSIMRPLSELLIQTILAQRYPELHTHQVSCHATSKNTDRVTSCGRCEKCRRIVGMLTAIGTDPRHCGYTQERIDACLQRLATHGVHQEAPGAQQLMHMLSQINAVALKPNSPVPPKEHPEILKMRFDPECSPMHCIPVDLRVPLLQIFSQYAQGAVQRHRRAWKPIDVFTHPDLTAPYAYEIDAQQVGAASAAQAGDRMEPIWGHLTWPQIDRYLKTVDIALLPVGSTEQHGPHLPLDTDTFDADYLARKVAESCTHPRPLVLPAVAYGVSYHHSDFRGTLSISNESLSRLIYDIGMSAAANGIRKLVIINGHGGNAPALNHAAQMINRDARIFVCVDTGETSDVDIEALVETPNDVHAGEIETSTSLAVRPHMVRLGEVLQEIPRFSSRYLDFTSKRGVSWYAYTEKISDSGIMGNPLLASAEKGKKIWEIMIVHLTALVEDLKQMSLEEIHQRRL